MDVWFFHVVGIPNVGLTASGLVLAAVVAPLVFVVMSRRISSPNATPPPAHARNRNRDR
jgi:hypothetical protein